MKIKISKIVKILLGIDLILLGLSALLIDTNFLNIDLREVHPLLGIALLVLGTIHILSHRRIKK
jgi:hypothetical protein